MTQHQLPIVPVSMPLPACGFPKILSKDLTILINIPAIRINNSRNFENFYRIKKRRTRVGVRSQGRLKVDGQRATCPPA